jgi:hypothetical protein
VDDVDSVLVATADTYESKKHGRRRW